MLTFKRKKLIFIILLALLSSASFSAFSSWEMNFLVKSYLSGIFMQAVVALIYLSYRFWDSR